LYSSEDTVQGVTRQAAPWEKVFAAWITRGGVLSRMYKVLFQISREKDGQLSRKTGKRFNLSRCS